MKYIDPSFTIIPQLSGSMYGLFDHIEQVARTCYKSENNIQYTDHAFEDIMTVDINGNIVKRLEENTYHSTTAEAFVQRLINSKHGAMLEHATVYLTILEKTVSNRVDIHDIVQFYRNDKYSEVVTKIRPDGKSLIHYITTNYRVIVENNRMSDMKYFSTPQKHHKHRYTVKFITDRGVANEFVRHRTMSFGQESTRFCLYSKNKFGNEISVIRPWWMPKEMLNMAKPGPYSDSDGWHILNSDNNKIYDIDETTALMTTEFINIEKVYNKITTADGVKDKVLTAQDARHMLPLGLKTELVITGFTDAWKQFFNLRYFGISGAPHPEAKRIVEPLYKEFEQRGYLKEY